MQASCTVTIAYGGRELTAHDPVKGTIQVAPELDVKAIGKLIEEAIQRLRGTGIDARETNYSFILRFR